MEVVCGALAKSIRYCVEYALIEMSFAILIANDAINGN